MDLPDTLAIRNPDTIRRLARQAERRQTSESLTPFADTLLAERLTQLEDDERRERVIDPNPAPAAA